MLGLLLACTAVSSCYFREFASQIRKIQCFLVISGSLHSIERLKNNLDPDIETMEGASFFYICAREKVDFLAIRAISNMVEPVRKSWDIPLALSSLAGKVNELFLMLI